MTPQIDASFLQYGAIGALAAVMLALFLWTFKVIFSRGLKHLDEIASFMTKTVAELTKISQDTENIHTSLESLTHEIRDRQPTRAHGIRLPPPGR